MPLKNQSNILISFVGNNDAGKLTGKTNGAILTALSSRKFDETILLWTPPAEYCDYYKITNYIKSEIEKQKLCKKITKIEFDINNPTDHNTIYPKLLEICKSLPGKNNYTAAIASGTPAMQVCWILMAESGDFNIKLIRSNEPKFGKPLISEIKLGTGLPKVIKRLEKENRDLKKLLPAVKMNIIMGELKIGEEIIKLSPIQFAYYRYFLERTKEEKEYERFGNAADTPKQFLKKIIEFHKESFPDAYLTIKESENILEKGYGADIRTFRANISKLNKKIFNNIDNSKFFTINTRGTRYKTSYGVDLPPEKIKII